MISSTDSHFVVGSIGTDGQKPNAVETLMKDTVDALREKGYDVQLLPVPTCEELFPRLTKSPIPPFVPNASYERLAPLLTLPGFKAAPSLHDDNKTRVEKDWPCVIIHSSGSTARFPKTIRSTQRLTTNWGCFPWYGEVDVGGEVLGCGFGLPPFHGIGMVTQALVPLTSVSLFSI